MPAYVAPTPTGRLRPAPFQLCPGCVEAFGAQLNQVATAGLASATWPANNTGYMYPFSLNEPRKALQMWVYNGTVASGNIDLGIYDAAGTLLVSLGSTAQAGTSALQIGNITDTELAPFTTYYAALALSSTVGTVFRMTGSVNVGQVRATGLVQISAFPLASGTFAQLTNNYLPWFGIDFVGTF
jgi:hypothetical protein